MQKTGEKTEEISVDFPFYETDSYSLTLAQLKEPAGEYELRLYDKDGKILQQISCGSLAEPIEFSYDIMKLPVRVDFSALKR